MIVLNNTAAKDYLKQELAWAVEAGLINELVDRLGYLGRYSCNHSLQDTRCFLYEDHAPHSFYFVMERFNPETEQYDFWFNGGLIYNPDSARWGVHT